MGHGFLNLRPYPRVEVRYQLPGHAVGDRQGDDTTGVEHNGWYFCCDQVVEPCMERDLLDEKNGTYCVDHNTCSGMWQQCASNRQRGPATRNDYVDLDYSSGGHRRKPAYPEQPDPDGPAVHPPSIGTYPGCGQRDGLYLSDKRDRRPLPNFPEPDNRQHHMSVQSA